MFAPEHFPSQRILHYLRLNSFAWLPVFLMGIAAARAEKKLCITNYVVLVISILLCFGLLFVVNASYYLWVLMPIVALAFFSLSAIAVDKIPVSRSFGIWLGKMSAYIFVSHPIALLLVEKSRLEAPLIVHTSIYVTLFLLLSIMYKQLHVKLQVLFNNKVEK